MKLLNGQPVQSELISHMARLAPKTRSGTRGLYVAPSVEAILEVQRAVPNADYELLMDNNLFTQADSNSDSNAFDSASDSERSADDSDIVPVRRLPPEPAHLPPPAS